MPPDETRNEKLVEPVRTLPATSDQKSVDWLLRELDRVFYLHSRVQSDAVWERQRTPSLVLRSTRLHLLSHDLGTSDERKLLKAARTGQ